MKNLKKLLLIVAFALIAGFFVPATTNAAASENRAYTVTSKGVSVRLYPEKDAPVKGYLSKGNTFFAQVGNPDAVGYAQLIGGNYSGFFVSISELQEMKPVRKEVLRETEVYAYPATEADREYYMLPGEVDQFYKVGNWCATRIGGFVLAKNVASLRETKNYVVLASSLNLREGANLKYEICSWMKRGKAFKANPLRNGWLRKGDSQYASGSSKYVFEYTKKNKAKKALKVYKSTSKKAKKVGTIPKKCTYYQKGKKVAYFRKGKSPLIGYIR